MASLNNPNLLLSQSVELVHQIINRRIRSLNLPLDEPLVEFDLHT